MAGSINLICPTHKSIDKSIGNVTEHRADDLFEELAGKLVMQLEFNLAGIFGQHLEVPSPLQPAEWPIDQPDIHQGRENLVVFGCKRRFHGVIVDVQGSHRLRRIAKLDFGVAAPWEKGGVILATIDQLEHAFSRLFDQDSLFNQSHAVAAFPNPVES